MESSWESFDKWVKKQFKEIEKEMYNFDLIIEENGIS